MDYNYLAELLFPDVTATPDDMEKKYPPRNLPEGAKVTRFAPSPTGFVHLGGVYQTMVDERSAHLSGGVFYLRIEDTDRKREIQGATENLIKTLALYGINFDEGAVIDKDGKVCDNGLYGPYKQSKRVNIYHVYAKQLVKDGRAYPVFATKEELKKLESKDKKAEVKNRKWTDAISESQRIEMLKQREFTIESVNKNLVEGNPFVLRILSDGAPNKMVKFNDLIKGDLNIPENDEDFVLLKSDGIPTYHFAHVVDDHLMRTTHVIRGEEWLPSIAKHLQLFRYLNFKTPKYMHTAQIMQIDANGHKKKLSKRDMGFNMSDYTKNGYSSVCVAEYLLTILNSNYDEWRMQNPDKHYTAFPFSINKMSKSGCLLDIVKLSDISKNVVSRMSAEDVFRQSLAWAREYDKVFAAQLSSDENYAKSVISIGRGGKKPRKDYGTWVELKNYMQLFYDDTFAVADAYPEGTDAADVKTALVKFLETYNPSDDQNAWFEKIKAIAASLGYAADMKDYKANPSVYRGSVADVSMFLRVAVTGRLNSPDMYTVMQILGDNRVRSRIKAMLK
jgi:glutamyl-tRNA synthetase